MSQWKRTIRIMNNSVLGDYAGNTDRGQSASRHSQGMWSLSHCGGRPYTVPLGVTPVVPVSGVHTHAVSSIMGSPTQTRNDTSLWGQSIDDRGPLQGPLSPPPPSTSVSGGPAGSICSFPTGEHGGSRGQASTCSFQTGEHGGSRGQESPEAPRNR